MAYASVAPTTDPTYGEIDGFGQATAAPSATPLPTVVSKVVTVHCNQTIAFYNLDRSEAHTASYLGPATPPTWPVWNNPNGSTFTTTNQFSGGSLTPITYPAFSTTLFPLGTGFNASLVYSTGPTAGTLVFGDYNEYRSTISMRTVINVLCP